MADTTYTDNVGPAVKAAWLNDINNVTYRVLGKNGVVPVDAATLRSNVGAAASGANNDITSLAGLTTALSIGQGGTGATTAGGARTALVAAGTADNNVFTGNNSFNNPVTVANATAAGHALNKGQADAAYMPVGSTPKQIQSITASVASNALTVTTAATTLDFRNATLTNGAPISGVSVPALSIVAPSGSTLGGTNTVAMRIVVVVLYNGGSPQLGIVNLAGGVNLDETTLLSTTAISASATSANTVYSTTAVSNSPFRVIGFVDIVCSTPSTWVPAPTLVQGAGGQAIGALSSFGSGQTIQDVTSSRAGSTTYYNTTGRAITVYLVMNVGSGQSNSFYINGVLASVLGNVGNSTTQISASLVIPDRGNYSITITGSSVASWRELR